MHIETITHTGHVSVTGDLTGDSRFVRIAAPVFTARLDPGEMLVSENPEAWVEPLQSDEVVDRLVETYREWLIAQR
jgi:hypothetical protein